MAKRGAPKGNQNARKHGFYSQVLDETGKLNLEDARDMDGLFPDCRSPVLPRKDP